MRSLLFVPGHDARKLAKGLDCGADALILDLEDSVPGRGKGAGTRRCAPSSCARIASDCRCSCASTRSPTWPAARRSRRRGACAAVRHRAAEVRERSRCRARRCRILSALEARDGVARRLAAHPADRDRKRRGALRNGQLRARGGAAVVRDDVGRRGSRHRHRCVCQSRRRTLHATVRARAQPLPVRRRGRGCRGRRCGLHRFSRRRRVARRSARRRRGRLRCEGGDPSRTGSNRSTKSSRRATKHCAKRLRSWPRSRSNRGRAPSTSAGACSIARI